MRRYIRQTAWQPDGEWLSEPSQAPQSIDVIQTASEPQWTGLYDATGTRLMAIDEPRPIGFLARIED